MEDESKVNTLLLANNDEVISSFRRALSSTSNLLTSSSTEGALEILAGSEIEVIISTPDFASSSGLHFFEQIMPDFPDPVRILITDKDDLDAVIEAINKGQIYKYVVRPWTDRQIDNILKEASKLYHLRTDLDKKVSDYNEQLLQVELNLESLIEDIEASGQINTNVKFDYITRLKSTITLLGTPGN
jgi:response regulator RpfG family c-di-GMP phosphodiesterase